VDVTLCSLKPSRLLNEEMLPGSFQLLHSFAIAIHLSGQFLGHMKCLCFPASSWTHIFLVSCLTQHSHSSSIDGENGEKKLNSGINLFSFILLWETIEWEVRLHNRSSSATDLLLFHHASISSWPPLIFGMTKVQVMIFLDFF